MANSFFAFKQFTVHQNQCAMKVCTDACLFGAWVTQQIPIYFPQAKQILDIGTGTGLLSLMIAQQTDATITALEIDEAASEQAFLNFKNSPWQHQLQIQVADIVAFVPPKTYQWIVCNPPFYENSLPTTQARRNTALHSSQLTLLQLLQGIQRLLSADGYATLLLPFHRFYQLQQLAEDLSLHVHLHTSVHQTTRHGAFRSMVLLSKIPAAASQSNQLTIKNEAVYTTEFTQLLHPYYL